MRSPSTIIQGGPPAGFSRQWRATDLAVIQTDGIVIWSGRGGGGQKEREAVQRRYATGAKEVECWQFPVQSAHAQYFEVCRTAKAAA
ncbi:hypothetical protein LTR17_018266 [Elasticomyces elasticus]|nr:hypothetical protein LTR17_018266 [Elasticomyces elasticus]